MAASSGSSPDDVIRRVRARWNPEKLRAQIVTRGLTQEQLARAADLPVSTVRSYLRSGKNAAVPSGANLVILAEILNADPIGWFDVEIQEYRR